MQKLFWTDTKEIDVINKTDEVEIKKSKDFYQVGSRICFNSSFGMCYGKIINKNNETNTIDVLVQPSHNIIDGIKFNGKTIIYNVPISALF